jgi:excisionase family DNA binding protein
MISTLKLKLSRAVAHGRREGMTEERPVVQILVSNETDDQVGAEILSKIGGVELLRYDADKPLPAEFRGAEVLVPPYRSSHRPLGLIKDLPNLRMVQLLSAGADEWSGDVPPDEGEADTLDTKYLTVEEAAAYINTGVRFVRRLIAERRIAFHKVGAHVRLAVEDLEAFIQSGRVEPITRGSVLRDLRRAA